MSKEQIIDNSGLLVKYGAMEEVISRGGGEVTKVVEASLTGDKYSALVREPCVAENLEVWHECEFCKLC